jgi:nucleoside-diphosphate kinase
VPTPSVTPESFLAFKPGDLTFAMIKPDGHAGHREAILDMIRAKGIVIERMSVTRLTKTDADVLYYQHLGKPYFAANASFVMSGPVTLLVLAGPDVVEAWRALMGTTDSAKAAPDTIRGRFGDHATLNRNVVHGADSPLSAFRETLYFFGGQRGHE